MSHNRQWKIYCKNIGKDYKKYVPRNMCEYISWSIKTSEEFLKSKGRSCESSILREELEEFYKFLEKRGIK